jgi:hypothetical protein
MSGSLMISAGLVDILENMFVSAKGLIVMAMILVAMVFVIMTWMRTRSLVPTLGALLLGAFVVMGVYNFGFFSDRITEDIDRFAPEEGDGQTNPGLGEQLGGSSDGD